MKKILVLCPSSKISGGVSNYWDAIFRHYNCTDYKLERFSIGKRDESHGYIIYVMYFMLDLILLFVKLFHPSYVLVILNPSLSKVSVARDAFFLLIAKLQRKKTIVFWRGWNKSLEITIDTNVSVKSLFVWCFKKADAFIVLGECFKSKLLSWGMSQQFFIETTTVDDQLLVGCEIKQKVESFKACNHLQLLFLSRIEKDKGIVETIDAFVGARDEGALLDATLIIAGDGPYVSFVEEYIKEKASKGVKYIGFVRGEAKREVLKSSHVMCLPTSYGEGLPNAIIEAMAFGLPVLTRPVGGIPDNFEDGENGYYVSSTNQKEFSALLKKVALDKKELARIAINNSKLARERFLASVVSVRLANICRSIIKVKASC